MIPMQKPFCGSKTLLPVQHAAFATTYVGYILSFIGSAIKKTGISGSPYTLATVPKLLIPAIVFYCRHFYSYFIGSSWATWALIMPIGLQLALSSGANIPSIVSAVLAGGSAGDNDI